MASGEIYRHRRKLSSDDVLHHCGRMDAVLFYQMLTGKFIGKDKEQVAGMFQGMLESPQILTTVMVIIVVAGILVCSFGLQRC